MVNNQNIVVLGVFLTIIFWLGGYSVYAAMCFPLMLVFLMVFIRNLSVAIPFRELAMVVATLQLLASSFLAFYIQDPDAIFKPKGSPEAYFKFAVPGVLLFGLGLFLFKPRQRPDSDFFQRLSGYDLASIGKRFVYIGWAAFVLSPFMPGAISYFVTLLVFLSYTGGIILLFSKLDRSQKGLWIGFAFLPVVRDALFAGIFFLAMIWIAYLTLYFLFRAQKGIVTNALIIILGIYFVVVIDTAKKDYRSITGERGRNLGIVDKGILFGSLFLDNASFNILSDESNLSGRVTRSNQGALVTWVMVHTPANQAFGEGGTVKDAILAAIFPRFLMPNKAKAGGKDNFEKYTGHKLNQSTSMNISLLGEGWANFGYWGGLIFMFCVGTFYSYVYRSFTGIMQKYPIYFFFIPFVFLYVIKAEDDLLTPLNHIFKALMVLFALHHLVIKKIEPVDA